MGLTSLKCHVKFRVDLIYSVKDTAISFFLTFGLKLPNHPHSWGVLVGFDTLSNEQETPKGTSLGEFASFEV